ncbi:MAG: hypothetical protein DYG92_08985 [Leptolyngbya sp. PLA1]|nr:hypothetical protein [Leptolyngbya sp. PLA1]
MSPSVRDAFALAALAIVGAGHAIAQSVNVDARASVFDAGRAAALVGSVTPVFLSLPDGCIRYLEVSAVSGEVRAFPASLPGGPDGNANYATVNTTINPAQGVSGARHPRVMALLGVFTTDAEPQSPSPDTVDFLSFGTNFAQITPELNQVFWIGDGRTDANALQRFAIPEGATRLFLGFADAPNFRGDPAPGSYSDNSGSLSVTVAPVVLQPLPTIGVQPADFEVCPGTSILLQCNGLLGGPWGYQWRKNGQNIEGATTEELLISSAGPEDSGEYDCLVGNSCRVITSRLASVTVFDCCPDMTADGNIDQDDVNYLANVIAGGENPLAVDPDFNRDGNADQDDVLALINAVGGGGCP